MKKSLLFLIGSLITLIVIISFISYNLVDSYQQDSISEQIKANVQSLKRPNLSTENDIDSEQAEISSLSIKDEPGSRLKLNPSEYVINDKWKVLSWSGAPYNGAHVKCIPVNRTLVNEWLSLESEGSEPKPTIYDTYSGVDGSFDFPDLESGTYYLRAEAPGFAYGSTLLDLTNKRPYSLKITLGNEKKIDLVLFDRHQNRIEGVDFDCYLSTWYSFSEIPLDEACEILLFDQEGITNNKGKLSFKGLSFKNTYVLYAEPHGYVPIFHMVNNLDIKEQRLVLRKACYLEGHVLGKDKKPIIDSEVYYREPQDLSQRYYPDHVDEEGRFRFESVPEGQIQLQASHGDFGNTMAKLEIKSDTLNYHDLILPKGVKLKVTVHDQERNPLEGIDIMVKDLDSGAYVAHEVTDKRGTVQLHGFNINNTNYIWTDDPSGWYSLYSDTIVLDSDTEIEIILHKRKGIPLVVKDASTGELITKYKTFVCSYNNRNTDQEIEYFHQYGRVYEIDAPEFSFKYSDKEVFEIIILADGYQPKSIATTAFPELVNGKYQSIEVLLRPGNILKGYVFDASTEKAISNANVSLCVNGFFDKKPCIALDNDRNSITNEEGYFTLNALPENSFHIKVSAEGYAPEIFNSYELDTSSSQSNANKIILWPSCSLTGKVTSQSGQPLNHAQIQVRLKETNDVFNTTSFPNGYYMIGNLPSGDLEVVVWSELDRTASKSKMTVSKSIQLSPGQQGNLDFTFEGSSTIKGVCYLDRKIIHGVIIDILDERGNKIRTIHSSETGLYTADGIPEGNLTIQARTTSVGIGGYFKTTVSIDENTTNNVDIIFKGKSIYGTIADSAGNAIHAAEIEILTPSFFRNYLTYSDRNGNYAIYNVAEGDYYMTARFPGFGEEMKGPWLLGGDGKDARQVDFILLNGVTARIHVEDSNGIPISNANVMVSNNINQGFLWTCKTKFSGIAIFENLKTESFSAIAFIKDFSPGCTKFFTVAGEITDTEITLTKGGNFQVEVIDVNSVPISGAQVHLKNYTLLGIPPSRLVQMGFLFASDSYFLTDEKGVFSLGLLPPGTYNLEISKGVCSAQSTVHISSGKETLLKVLLTKP